MEVLGMYLGHSQSPLLPGEGDLTSTCGRRASCCASSLLFSLHLCAWQEWTFWTAHFTEEDVHKASQHPQPYLRLHTLLIQGEAQMVPLQTLSTGEFHSIWHSHTTASYFVLNSDERNYILTPIPNVTIIENFVHSIWKNILFLRIPGKL
jgi:hypothetical protein